MNGSGLSGRTAGARPRARAACLLALLAVGSYAAAQQSAQRITPNFKDADITQIAEAVSTATGKNFIIDPRVRGQVTMLSSTPMSPDAFYQAFLSILQVHGYVAIPAGNVIKIIPDANARQYAGDDLSEHVSPTSDEFVTQVVAVKSVSAPQLVPILRPLIPQQGHLAAYAPSNILIISDRASNVNRIIRIISRIDQVGDSDVDIVPLQNASATELVHTISSLYQQQGGAEAGGALAFKVVADERSNSVLLSGEQSQRLRLKALIAHLDTPLQAGGDTQVRYLRYADATKIAKMLKEQITGVAQAASGGTGGGAAGASTPAAQAEKGTILWADPETNALVITASPKAMRALNAVIDKLDIRRAQVLVEGIICDVSLSKEADLGVNWAVFDSSNGSSVPAAGFIAPINGTSIVDLAELIANPATSTASIPTGAIVGVGRVVSGGLNFAAMLNALRSDSNSNVIATPSAVTTDNQEATIKVAQEVPFLTGSFSNTGTSGGSVSPFQTIQREEVGTILKLTPTINGGGDAVMLKISLESSQVIPKADDTSGAVDITTSKRTIDTDVLIEDGGTIVLGGLTSNDYTRSETRVPWLGAIPIIGNAFKTRSGSSTKTDLMVFIKPTILRDGTQTAFATNTKYNYIRDEQREVNGGKRTNSLLPGVAQPNMPGMALPGKGADAMAPTTPEEKAKAAEETRKETIELPGPAGATPAATAPAPRPAAAPAVPPPPPSNGTP